MSWDEARVQILARQIEFGVIPADTQLTDRIDEIPAWDSLSDDERRLYARQMEVFAGQMEWVDLQIGRVVDELERIGELDNTLIFVTSDNGASGEGGLAGTFNETYVLNGLQTPFDSSLAQIGEWYSGPEKLGYIRVSQLTNCANTAVKAPSVFWFLLTNVCRNSCAWPG